MDLVGSGGDGGERIGDSETAVPVAVPVHADFFTAVFHNVVNYEFHEVESTFRSGVTDRVAENDGTRAAADRGGIETLNGLGIGADGVFRDVHRRKAVGDGELDSFFGGALEMVDGPVFNQAANRAGTEERGGFDGNPDALGDFDDGTNVGFDGARSAVRLDAHLMVGDFAGEDFDVSGGARARAGQTDVYGIDAERFHQMEDFDFFFDGGVVDRGILQAVAKSFVIQEDFGAGRDGDFVREIPIVDEFVCGHASSLSRC